MSDDAVLTPVWCALCEVWVPAEHEPHVTIRSDGSPGLPHFARWQVAQPQAAMLLKSKWRPPTTL
jgi:hypothetical protein